MSILNLGQVVEVLLTEMSFKFSDVSIEGCDSEQAFCFELLFIASEIPCKELEDERWLIHYIRPLPEFTKLLTVHITSSNDFFLIRF